jgi:predicted peroxiredoxin
VYYALKSGVVLSYAALTVIPTHLLLTVPDATIFLAWDGPRLVIASVKGNYKGFDSLPVGSVVDLEEARKQGKVEILTDDQTIVKKVLEKEIQNREEEMKKQKEGGDK